MKLISKKNGTYTIELTRYELERIERALDTFNAMHIKTIFEIYKTDAHIYQVTGESHFKDIILKQEEYLAENTKLADEITKVLKEG